MADWENTTKKIECVDRRRFDAAENGAVVFEVKWGQLWDAIEAHQHFIIATTTYVGFGAERRGRSSR